MEIWEEEQWVTATEPRLKQINQSPSKSRQTYLNSDHSQRSSLNLLKTLSPLKTLQHREEYLQEGKLKH